jgi:Flp pilus assembly pilin Flp
MARVATLLAAFALAGLLGWGVPLVRLFDAFQPMIVALSIMIAAILVRLNRGMPTLEWKSLELQKRTQLTSKILDLTTEYAWIVGLIAASLIGLVTLSVVGKEAINTIWPDWAQRAGSAGIGWLGALCIARMSYVIWRDLDIVKLQKQLIDESAARDLGAIETKSASDKVADIRAAGMLKLKNAPPREWGR